MIKKSINDAGHRINCRKHYTPDFLCKKYRRAYKWNLGINEKLKNSEKSPKNL